MTALTRMAKAAAVGLVAASIVAGLAGCVQQDYETTLPPLIETQVPDASKVDVRMGPTASPGLRTVSVSMTMERQPVTSEDLYGVLDAIFDATSLPSVYTLSVSTYGTDAEGEFLCLDLSTAIADLGLTQFEFDSHGQKECSKLLGDPDELRDWWIQHE